MKDEAASFHPSSFILHPCSSSFILHTLESANLFILPLDNERRWYRYHQLFSEFLRNRLEALYPSERIAELHRRAADWYEANAFISEAIKHALGAQDFERAARLIEKVARQTLVLGEVATLLGWLGVLPENILRERPHLCLARAWVAFITGQIDDVAYRGYCGESHIGHRFIGPDSPFREERRDQLPCHARSAKLLAGVIAARLLRIQNGMCRRNDLRHIMMIGDDHRYSGFRGFAYLRKRRYSVVACDQ